MTVTKKGLEADLHLLPSAIHTAEALDASLAAQDGGRRPLVGISHDISADFRRVGGVLEAVQIAAVNSADIVADPSAGGLATRAVAGGITDGDTIIQPEEAHPVTIEELLELVKGATPEQRAQVLADLGVTEDAVAALAANDKAAADKATADAATAAAAAAAGDSKDLVVAGVTESTPFTKGSAMAGMLVAAALGQAKLDDSLVPLVTEGLGDTFTQGELTRQIESVQRVADSLDRQSLTPRVPDIRVQGDDRDKRLRMLDGLISGNAQESYRSLKGAYRDIMGVNVGLEDIDAREILGACTGFDSSRAQRATESATTATWAQIFGDSVTRRMIAEYGLPQLQTWRKIVSEFFNLSDFRTQRITRMGGYGVLPTVAEGGVYTALVTPPDEEATYAAAKRGGTEDLTWETVKNDDLRAVQRIPKNLARAASQTLYRFVWDFLATNGLIFDGVALFAAGHNNTDAVAALAQATLSAGRRKMRKQTAYGDASEVLGVSTVPKYLVVPSDLEEIAFQLATSAVAIAAGSNASDIPNIHQGIEPIVVDYIADTNDWFLVADPAMCPTIEIGFMDGKQEPELFVQDAPTEGAVFTNDKITWKIRHTYGGAVTDYRGFYRGQG